MGVLLTESVHPPVIEARNLSKSFSGRKVLRKVDLTIIPGEVHGLLGQNGSGKSTLIKILAGYHEPDPGASLTVRGEPVDLPLTPSDPARLGMSFVHQDLGLLHSGTVLENFRVGRFQTGLGWRISWPRERDIVREGLAPFGLSIHPETLVSSLDPVERAMIAIARALERLRDTPRGLLVLDEPTAYLPRDGVDRLFEVIREVTDSGFGVIFVTHKLEEVRVITDRVSILRDGALVETAPTRSLNEDELITRILGFSLEKLYPEPQQMESDFAFVARNVSDAFIVNFSLEVHRGEVVGLTGLLGMGYERVPYLLFAAETADSGSISIDGRSFELAQFSPKKAIRAGLALLPGDRQTDGGTAKATAVENMTLATLRRHFSGGVLHRRREYRRAHALMLEFDVRPAEPKREFATFSGGNQQKALVAKWFETRPKVLLLHEPTQGVDVGARRQIFQQIRDLAGAGAAVIMASAEYKDLSHLCDRVIVFRHGRAVSELRGETLSYERILEQCFREDRRSWKTLAEGPR